MHPQPVSTQHRWGDKTERKLVSPAVNPVLVSRNSNQDPRRSPGSPSPTSSFASAPGKAGPTPALLPNLSSPSATPFRPCPARPAAAPPPVGPAAPSPPCGSALPAVAPRPHRPDLAPPLPSRPTAPSVIPSERNSLAPPSVQNLQGLPASFGVSARHGPDVPPPAVTMLCHGPPHTSSPASLVLSLSRPIQSIFGSVPWPSAVFLRNPFPALNPLRVITQILNGHSIHVCGASRTRHHILLPFSIFIHSAARAPSDAPHHSVYSSLCPAHKLQQEAVGFVSVIHC